MLCALLETLIIVCLSSFEHQILNSRSAIKPEDPRGGILADDMGLGKTLTVLSAIVMSLDEARASAKTRVDGKQSNSDKQRVKSTLVVVPSRSM